MRGFFHCNIAFLLPLDADKRDIEPRWRLGNPSKGVFSDRGHEGGCRLCAVSVTIEPEPSDSEREAILALLGPAAEPRPGEWAEAALLEGVENGEPDP
jgi:hypothetical protein